MLPIMMDIITSSSSSSSSNIIIIIISSSSSSSNIIISSSSSSSGSSSSSSELSVSSIFGAHRALLFAVCALGFSDFPVIPCRCRQRSLHWVTAGFLVNVRALQFLQCSYSTDVTKLDAVWSKSKNCPYIQRKSSLSLWAVYVIECVHVAVCARKWDMVWCILLWH
jgi:hypothetical protein